MAIDSDLSYTDRLATFSDFWNHHQATARQLAAIGHVYDRPPLEAIEEGSRCVSCANFVRRDLSIDALEAPLGPRTQGYTYRTGFEGFQFHHGSCIRLQVRIPLELQATLAGLHGGSFQLNILKEQWEQRIKPPRPSYGPTGESTQTSLLFSLPTELRLQIYGMVLPALDDVTDLIPLNRDSARIATKAGVEKTGPRDLTKCNILRTCRAVHNEALDILYTPRTYRFANSKTLYLFLRHIGKNGRDLLKAIDIYCGNREDAITFSLLATCPKLRAITIRLPRPVILFPRAPLWCVDGMTTLLSLRVIEEVKFGDCGPDVKNYLRDGSEQAAMLKHDIMQPFGEKGSWNSDC